MVMLFCMQLAFFHLLPVTDQATVQHVRGRRFHGRFVLGHHCPSPIRAARLWWTAPGASPSRPSRGLPLVALDFAVMGTFTPRCKIRQLALLVDSDGIKGSKAMRIMVFHGQRGRPANAQDQKRAAALNLP
jgi:hypothetical protein